MTTEGIGELTAEHEPPTDPSLPVPILFVHGLWAGAWIFREWLELAASRGWDAWAPNLRGREGSRPGTDIGRASMQDFAGDVREILDRVGDAVLLGYSMGGLAAQMVADDSRIKALVLLCSVPPRGIVALSGPVVRRSWRYLPAMAMGRAFEPTRADTDEMTMNRMTPLERDRWFPRFIRDSGRASGQIALGRIAVEPSRITCPVLVVSAEHDRISPPSIQPKLVERYRADHLPVAGRAHLIAVETRWEGTANAILDWAERAVAR
jgi:pimeloyl-ACP methyl ester carboxylesterase